MADDSAVECPQCGHTNEPDEERCVNCNLDLEWALENWDKCVSGPAESYPPLILLSDDEVGALTLIGIMMERAGYRVAKSHDAYETLDLTEHFVPDLIITDISKPGMNGIEMTSFLKFDPDLRDIPVMILSAKGDAESVAEGMAAGAIRYLSKPILHHNLIGVIASVLSGDILPLAMFVSDKKESVLPASLFENFEILTTQSRGEAIREARRLNPDLIAIDVHLPQESWLEILTGLKANENTKHIPVVIMADDTPPLRRLYIRWRARALGAHTVYFDSLNSERLPDVFQAVLREKRGTTIADKPQIECPQCGHLNRHNAVMCMYCHIDLEWALELGSQYWLEPAETRPPLIMWSSDKPELLSHYRKILEPEGYRVAMAPYAFNTIRLAERLQPDLIITDFAKPAVNGVEMITHLKTNPAFRDIPVILQTKGHGYLGISKALEAEATRIIPKTFYYFSDDNLVADIKSVMSGESFPLVMIQISWVFVRKSIVPNYTQYRMCQDVSHEGFNVWPLWYREDPVRMARLFNPAVLTIAYHLCEADGLEQLTRFKADPQVGSTPVVMWFKEPAPELEQQAMQCGAQAVYTGPPDGEALAKVLRSVLGKI